MDYMDGVWNIRGEEGTVGQASEMYLSGIEAKEIDCALFLGCK